MTLSKEELAKHRQRIREAATDARSRTEKLNIRFSPEEIERLKLVATRLDTKVMPMMRDWILDKLASEEMPEDMRELRSKISEIRETATQVMDILSGPEFHSRSNRTDNSNAEVRKGRKGRETG